jgi:ferritin-like metal-binding protein YciE
MNRSRVESLMRDRTKRKDIFMATLATDVTREVFITGLKNAHAVEHQALALIDRQLDRLENYPEVAEMLARHRAETEGQLSRVDELLGNLGESASGIKDTALSITGNLAALAHAPAPDEILKNAMANHAFENFEIAAYTSLIALAEHGGFGNAMSALEQSLGEEQRMAQWVLDSVPQLTLKYISLRGAGETASH